MTPRKRGFPASLFDMSNMKLLHEETRYEGSVEYTKHAVSELTPSYQPYLYIDLDRWSRIGFYMRLRKGMSRWMAILLSSSLFWGHLLILVALYLRQPVGIFSAVFTMVSVDVLTYVNEFVWRERDVDGYVRRFPVPAYDLKELLEDRLEERGYAFTEVEVQRRDVYEKPNLLIVRHSEATLIVVVWEENGRAFLHIGRNPSNDWGEIGMMKDLVDGLVITGSIVRDYDYLAHHH